MQTVGAAVISLQRIEPELPLNAHSNLRVIINPTAWFMPIFV